jgi:predicted transcriptional regulator YdeE
MKYRIVERDVFQVAGVKREFTYGTEDTGIPGIPEFWGEANQKLIFILCQVDFQFFFSMRSS